MARPEVAPLRASAYRPMIDFSRMDSPNFTGSPAGHPTPASAPLTWSEALGGLLSARVSLLQIELRSALRQAGRRALLLAVAALALIFAWALGLVGGITALAAATSWPWHGLALAAALLHALVAAICLWVAKTSPQASLPLTCAEFKKDCEWLNTLKTPRKSND
jgi:uncharacterized membrane protein YqjE